MMKALKGLLAVIVVVVVLLVVALLAHPLWVGPLVKVVAEKVGPRYTGTPIAVQGCGVNLYSGHFEIIGFDLSNPEGCSESSAASAGSLKVDFDTLSALKDVVLVHSVEVSGVFVSYVQGASKKYNFTEIADNAKAATGSAEPAEQPAEEQPVADVLAPEAGEPAPEGQASAEEKPGKKVVIERLSIGDVKVSMLGMKIPLVPGTIVLKDIGKQSNGVSFKEAWTEILAQVLAQVQKSAGAVGDQLFSFGQKGLDLGKQGLDLGKRGLDVGTEGVKSALESAKKLDLDGAKDVLKDTGKNLESLGKGLKGLFNKQ